MVEIDRGARRAEVELLEVIFGGIFFLNVIGSIQRIYCKIKHLNDA